MVQLSTLTYIKKLQKNNNKPWFEENRNLFNEAKDDFEKLVKDIVTSFGKVDADIVFFASTVMSDLAKIKCPTNHTWAQALTKEGRSQALRDIIYT